MASCALVLGGWAAVAESNEGRGRVDAVAAAEERPLDLPTTLPAPAAKAAKREATVVRPVPVTALFRMPVCPAAGADANVAPAKAVKAAGLAVAALGEDYPEAYSGHLGCRAAGKLIVYRVPLEAFDSAVREVAARQDVTLQLVKAPFSRLQQDRMVGWVDARRQQWATRGIDVRTVAKKPNGTLELGVDAADVAAAAERLAKFRTQVRVVPYPAQR